MPSTVDVVRHSGLVISLSALSINNTNNSTPMPPFQRPNGRGKGACIATQVFPRFDLLVPGEDVSFDSEMLEHRLIGDVKWSHRLGWIAIINSRLEVILDVFVRYPVEANRETKPGFFKFGVLPHRILEENGAVDAHIVEAWVKAIFRGRNVVLHGERLDRKAFMYEDVWAETTGVFDTQDNWGQRGLKTLADEVLGKTIQEDKNGNEQHSPVEDSVTTMELFWKWKPCNRVKLWNAWVATSAEEKAKYRASGPMVKEKHYQRQQAGGRGGHQGRGGWRGGRGGDRGRGGRGGRENTRGR